MRARRLIVVLALALLAPGAGHAEEVIAAPFASHDHTELCSSYNVVESCAALGESDMHTGRLDATTSLVSPGAGLLPGRGLAAATSTLVATHRVTRAMRGITYTFHIQLDQATVGGSSLLFGQQGPLRRKGEVYVHLDVRTHDCMACWRTRRIGLADEMGGRFDTRNQTLVLPVRLRDCHKEGGVPQGAVLLRASIIANQSLGFGQTDIVPEEFGDFARDREAPLADAGTATAVGRATLQRITVEETDPAPCEFIA